MSQPKKPLFETHADETLDRVRALYAQRGGEYSDTWRESQWITLKCVAKALGIKIPDDQCRAIAASVLVDAKYWRQGGGYKEDNLDDGIAYKAYLAGEMRTLLGKAA